MSARPVEHRLDERRGGRGRLFEIGVQEEQRRIGVPPCARRLGARDHRRGLAPVAREPHDMRTGFGGDGGGAVGRSVVGDDDRSDAGDRLRAAADSGGDPLLSLNAGITTTTRRQRMESHCHSASELHRRRREPRGHDDGVQHDVDAPAGLRSSTKETRYFQAVRYGEPLAPLAEYEAYFRRYAGQPVTMECTPDYFYGGAATAAAIKEACDPRVTIILREPVSRLISFFQFMQGRLQVPADMTLPSTSSGARRCPPPRPTPAPTTTTPALWGGQYARFLAAWLSAFAGRCDIYFFDDLLADPLRLLADQCRRLGIDPALLPAAVPVDNSAPGVPQPRRAACRGCDGARLGRGVLHRYPKLYSTARRSYEAVNKAEAAKVEVPPTLRREIEALYRPWNDQLRDQLRDAGIPNLPNG